MDNTTEQIILNAQSRLRLSIEALEKRCDRQDAVIRELVKKVQESNIMAELSDDDDIAHKLDLLGDNNKWNDEVPV